MVLFKLMEPFQILLLMAPFQIPKLMEPLLRRRRAQKPLFTLNKKMHVFAQKQPHSMMEQNALPAICLNIGIMILKLANHVLNSNCTILKPKNALIAQHRHHS